MYLPSIDLIFIASSKELELQLYNMALAGLAVCAHLHNIQNSYCVFY